MTKIFSFAAAMALAIVALLFASNSASAAAPELVLDVYPDNGNLYTPIQGKRHLSDFLSSGWSVIGISDLPHPVGDRVLVSIRKDGRVTALLDVLNWGDVRGVRGAPAVVPKGSLRTLNDWTGAGWTVQIRRSWHSIGDRKLVVVGP
jgi:hypothetical protein